jgi:type II secretory pathway pseudopilin PulG
MMTSVAWRVGSEQGRATTRRASLACVIERIWGAGGVRHAHPGRGLHGVLVVLVALSALLVPVVAGSMSGRAAVQEAASAITTVDTPGDGRLSGHSGTPPRPDSGQPGQRGLPRLGEPPTFPKDLTGLQLPQPAKSGAQVPQPDATVLAVNPANREEFVAWPPPGYVPFQVVFPRWSFSHPSADFSQASVTMTQDQQNIALSLETVMNGYGENTIVWVPNGMSTSCGI